MRDILLFSMEETSSTFIACVSNFLYLRSNSSVTAVVVGVVWTEHFISTF